MRLTVYTDDTLNRTMSPTQIEPGGRASQVPPERLERFR